VTYKVTSNTYKCQFKIFEVLTNVSNNTTIDTDIHLSVIMHVLKAIHFLIVRDTCVWGLPDIYAQCLNSSAHILGKS